MTYPAGSLPDTSFQTAQTNAPHKSIAFAHGVSDLDLTDPANKLAPCAYELWATSTGNLVARLAGDTAEQTYPVVAGTVVRGMFVLVKSTSTADCICRQ